MRFLAGESSTCKIQILAYAAGQRTCSLHCTLIPKYHVIDRIVGPCSPCTAETLHLTASCSTPIKSCSLRILAHVCAVESKSQSVQVQAHLVSGTHTAQGTQWRLACWLLSTESPRQRILAAPMGCLLLWRCQKSNAGQAPVAGDEVTLGPVF